MEHLEVPFTGLIQEALRCYEEGREMAVDSALAIAFAEEMIAKMKMNG